MVNDALGDRMKEYERRNQYFLQRRTPVIIRVDGKAFHTFTRGFQKPFDKVLGNAMVQTMEYLCQNISGCIFGYVQSDEITLVLQDYRKLNTDAWFGYRTDKLCLSPLLWRLWLSIVFLQKKLDFLEIITVKLMSILASVRMRGTMNKMKLYIRHIVKN